MDDSDPRSLVLLVEDDANAARMLAQLLREDGYAVEVQADGATALARLGNPPAPHVIILDYRLPSVDGLTLVRAARTLAPRARVIMVTSYPEVVERGLGDANPDAILVAKPLSYDDLTKHIAGRER